MHRLNDRGVILCGYSTAVLFFLIGIPAISTDRQVIMCCLVSSIVILFIAAVSRVRYSKAFSKTDVWWIHIDLMVKLGLSLTAIRAFVWLSGWGATKE